LARDHPKPAALIPSLVAKAFANAINLIFQTLLVALYLLKIALGCAHHFPALFSHPKPL
jgi:hypothetical protein